MTGQLRFVRRAALLALSGLLLLVAVSAMARPVGASTTTGGTSTTVTASASTATTVTTPSSTTPSSTTPTSTPTSTTLPSSLTPTPIQVGPTTPTTTPASGSGGTVTTGGNPSPGLFDITGHIEAAIDSWFQSVVTDALNPVLTVLGNTLLATPNVTAQSRVGELWKMTAGIADSLLVLFVLVGGAIVMSRETLQTRTALKEVLPRIVVAAVAINASLGLAGLFISTADALSQALLGQGVGPSQAAVVLRQLVLGSLVGGGIFLVLIGAVIAVLAIVLLGTYVVRLALVIVLIVAAPIALVCHALPQTEGLAHLWWRAFSGVLLVQVAQSLVLITALRVFLATGGPQNLGIASTGGFVDLLVAACLCWLLVKIPSWVSRHIFSGSRSRGGMVRVVRDVVLYKGARSLLAGVGK